MEITNRKNLPDIIVRAASNDQYNPGKSDYSATTLLKSGYMVDLERKHKDDIQEDVADRLWSMYGTAMHRVIELAANEDDIVEERYYATLKGKIVSAQIDHYCDGVLTDFKFTSSYKIKKAITDGDKDYEAQLNIQAYLMDENGIKVDKICIIGLCRDWSMSKWNPSSYNHEHGYPDQIETIEFPIWPKEKQKAYIESRLDDMANKTPCDADMRWQKPTKYALMKEDGKRALKLADDHYEIVKYGINKGVFAYHDPDDLDKGYDVIDKDYRIETREQPCIRCESYCLVNDWCEFWTNKQKREVFFK